ncbi:hypothetical protein, partial [Paenibacillus xylanexedens]|uniref:hypothetical protein n=1 Tax=Paenibacillus xylanexedens TaxID=528191 RepID=UPI001C9301C2
NWGNLNERGYGMSMGERWRYEGEDGEYVVRLKKNGRVVRRRWNLGQDNGNGVVWDWNMSGGDEYGLRTKMYGRRLRRTTGWKGV